MEDSLTEEQCSFPIWLVGDSYPGDSVGLLKAPLDFRHPTRHTIWTPIWDAIQESVYPRRVDGTHLFVCNAAEKQAEGEPNKDFDDGAVQSRIVKLSGYLHRHKPAMVLCFGAWAYEFVRRASGPTNEKFSEKHWTVGLLGETFRESCTRFHPNRTTVFPLLHRIVASQWEYANNRFPPPDSNEGSYFSYVGKEIGKLLFAHRSDMATIWKGRYVVTDGV